MTTDTKPPPSEEEDDAVEAELAEYKALAHYHRSLVGTRIPKPDMSQAEAEKWTKDRLTALAPYAVTELERQIKFGNDRARAEAAKEILDRAGYSKNDQSVAHKAAAAPVVILVGSAMQPPWQQNKVVEGTVVKPALPAKSDSQADLTKRKPGRPPKKKSDPDARPLVTLPTDSPRTEHVSGSDAGTLKVPQEPDDA